MQLKFNGIFLGAAMLAAGAAPSAAQQPGGVMQLLSQCRADAADFCDDVRPGQGRIVACLYAHLEALRPGCRQAFRIGMAIRACAWDAKQFCDGVMPGEGRIAACLAGARERLSPGCRDVVAFWSGGAPGAGRWDRPGEPYRDDEERDLLK
jgi:Cysteine rich repeat